LAFMGYMTVFDCLFCLLVRMYAFCVWFLISPLLPLPPHPSSSYPLCCSWFYDVMRLVITYAVSSFLLFRVRNMKGLDDVRIELN
jgi:hypothetical protein